MTGAVTVLFNTDRFLIKQFQLFKKYVYADFIVCDNSTDVQASNRIQSYASQNGIRYIKTYFEERDSSRSHGMALNEVYKELRDKYNILGFFDHDLFPIQGFDINDLMKDKVIAGVPQIKGAVTYLWAGLVILNNDQIDKTAVDFMPSTIDGVGVDTGGELNKIWKHLPPDKYHFFAERPNDDVTRIYYDLVKEEPLFLHWRNGSNWANEATYEQRIDRLMQTI